MKVLSTTAYCLTLFMWFTFSNFACYDPCGDYLVDDMSFELEVDPLLDSLSAGDTLVVRSKINWRDDYKYANSTPKSLTPHLIARLKLFEIQPGRIETVPITDQWKIITEANSHEFYQDGFVLLHSAFCDEQECNYEVNIIPKKTGYYGISQDYTSIEIYDDCQYINLYSDGIRNGGTNNSELLQEISVTSIRIRNSFVRDPAQYDGLYFFKVVK